MGKKQRLDKCVQEQYPHLTRNQIQSFIMQGKVKVDGKVCTKSGQQVNLDVPIDLNEARPKYVCRAGFKLEKALEHFKIDVTDFVAMDAGLSTGGFTDCLLQNGAQRVYGVDVGYGQVHEKITADNRVVVMERTNLRHVKNLPELVDLVTLDLSFISVLKVMDNASAVLKDGGIILLLIKPQFEARREQVGRGGIIKDEAVHNEVVERVTQGIVDCGFEYVGVTESPITGMAGNKEFLAFFRKK
jgi:23S rRNA (cytidine1920-2'-O)/16S rRNA (cytidine1409-2'-O)-methyltransferase